jgi:type II secretory pathway component PulF
MRQQAHRDRLLELAVARSSSSSGASFGNAAKENAVTAKEKKASAVMFRSLGNMLTSGVPFLAALDAAIADATDSRIKGELARVKAAVLSRAVPEDAWTFLPMSAQLIWRAGQRKDLNLCCLRVAEILEP